MPLPARAFRAALLLVLSLVLAGGAVLIGDVVRARAYPPPVTDTEQAAARHRLVSFAPARHLRLPLQNANARLVILPEKPRAGQSALVAIEVEPRVGPPPPAVVVRVEREGIFGRRTVVVPQESIAHDAGWPGEYTLRVEFPASGLYWLYLREQGDRSDGRLGLGVWPRRGRPLLVVPAAAFAVLIVLALSRMRASRGLRTSRSS